MQASPRAEAAAAAAAPTMQLWRSGRAPTSCGRCPHRRDLVRAAAKKGGAAKGGGKKSSLAGLLEKKKQVEQAADLQVAQQAYRSPEVRSLLLFMASSYYKHTKKYLLEADFEALPDAVFNAPFALLAHNRFQEGVEDPLFIYANRAALELFEASWDELIGLPSRKSVSEADKAAEDKTLADRQQLLDAAATSGAVTNYEGWRQGLKGKRFKIKNVTLFNIEDASGDKIGQAALFDRYELNGKEVVVQGFQEAAAEAAAQAAAQAVPSAEEIEAAQAAVQQWADYVRALKEGQGLGNKDPQVQQAVTNLQAWKAQLANLQQRLEQALADAKAAFDDEDEEE